MVRLLLIILFFSLRAEAQVMRQSLIKITGIVGCVVQYPNPAATLTVTSGLTGWWKADAGLTLSGSTVTSWADQSGNGYTLTPPPGGFSGPQYVTSCPTGSTMQWNSTGSKLYNTSFPNLSAVTVFVVKHTLEGQNASHAGKYGGSGSGGWMLYDNGTRLLANAAFLTTSVAVDTTRTLISGYIDATGTAVFRNGTQVSSAAGATIATTTVPFEVSGYQNSATGTGYSSTGSYTITTYELLVYNRKLTTTERQSVESYLKTRWGTP